MRLRKLNFRERHSIPTQSHSQLQGRAQSTENTANGPSFTGPDVDLTEEPIDDPEMTPFPEESPDTSYRNPQANRHDPVSTAASTPPLQTPRTTFFDVLTSAYTSPQAYEGDDEAHPSQGTQDMTDFRHFSNTANRQSDEPFQDNSWTPNTADAGNSVARDNPKPGEADTAARTLSWNNIDWGYMSEVHINFFHR